MTIQETLELLDEICKYYPKFCEGRTEEYLEGIVVAWHGLLYDLPYELCVMALKKHLVDTKEGCYVPNAGQIRRNAMNICDSDTELTGSEAWGEVMKSIRQYGQYNIEKALESMSETTRKVVSLIGYREICLSDNNGVIRGQFLKMYEQFLKRENDKKLLPQGFAEQMTAIRENNKRFEVIKGGKEKDVKKIVGES